jgi:hypothetical protein
MATKLRYTRCRGTKKKNRTLCIKRKTRLPGFCFYGSIECEQRGAVGGAEKPEPPRLRGDVGGPRTDVQERHGKGEQLAIAAVVVRDAELQLDFSLPACHKTPRWARTRCEWEAAGDVAPRDWPAPVLGDPIAPRCAADSQSVQRRVAHEDSKRYEYGGIVDGLLGHGLILRVLVVASRRLFRRQRPRRVLLREAVQRRDFLRQQALVLALGMGSRHGGQLPIGSWTRGEAVARANWWQAASSKFCLMKISSRLSRVATRIVAIFAVDGALAPSNGYGEY